VNGLLTIIGLGPGDPNLLTPEAQVALDEAEALYGYAPYLERVAVRENQSRHVSDNRQEAFRAAAAIEDAARGGRVALVSGGDAGVFAMAAAVCEQIEHGPAVWREIDLRIVPGITAMMAAAARCGAPLGNDFCAISLSDNLKPWSLIVRRIDAAAEAGFVIAFYNPASRSRSWQFRAAIERLRIRLPPTTPAIFARAVSRPEEYVLITTLAEAESANPNMATLVIIGAPATRVVSRPGKPPLVYTPRNVSDLGA
jgi:precorrin-3B C17-methyltransferase